MRERHNVIFSKKLNNVLVELMPMTNSDMVYVDRHYTETLTERLWDIAELLSTDRQHIADLQDRYDELVDGAPTEYNTFKEIWDYINVNGDPKSALIELIDTKVDKEEGKGLSTHDLTDLLYEKLVNDYTKEELVERFAIVENQISDIHATINERFTVYDRTLRDHEERLRQLEHTSDALEEEVGNHEGRIENIEEAPNAYTTEDPEDVPPDATNQSFYYYIVSKDNQPNADDNTVVITPG